MKLTIPTVLLLALLSGCALPPPQPPAEMQTKFVGAEHDQYRQDGTGVITDQGFLR